jgi:hypothetical protein
VSLAGLCVKSIQKEAFFHSFSLAVFGFSFGILKLAARFLFPFLAPERFRRTKIYSEDGTGVLQVLQYLLISLCAAAKRLLFFTLN